MIQEPVSAEGLGLAAQYLDRGIRGEAFEVEVLQVQDRFVRDLKLGVVLGPVLNFWWPGMEGIGMSLWVLQAMRLSWMTMMKVSHLLYGFG